MPHVTDRRRLYPSDLSDAQWEFIKELIPSARRGGRSRVTNMRDVVNGVLYLINTGCAWRYMPSDFPPWKTIYHYYRTWIVKGVWNQMHAVLRGLIRGDANKSALVTYLIIDSQSVRAQRGECLAYDGFKRVRGRKRQILVDTMGLVHGVHVHAADLSDTKEGIKVLEKISPAQAQALQVVHADQGYCGSFEDAVYFAFKILPLINKRENTGQGKKKTIAEKKLWRKNRPIIKEAKRWVVERTFAWLNGYRRLSRDYERTVSSSETMIYIAMMQLMLRRKHP